MIEAKAITGIATTAKGPTASAESTSSSTTSTETSRHGEIVPRTMTIRVRPPNEDYWARTKAAIGQAWETGEYQGEELGFASLEQLFSVFTPKRWEIIDVLQKIGPTSLRGLSRTLHRDVKRVHQD